MKKILAIFLSALLICISLAPMSLAASDPGLATRVLEGDYDENASAVTEVEETTFTLVVKAPAVKKLTGVNLYVSFDPTVLAVADAGAAGWLDAEDNFTPYFNGMPVSGFKSGSNSEYAFGWVSSDGVTKKSAKDLFFITFNVIDTTKTETVVDLYLDEFLTDDGNDANDVASTIRVENKTITFNYPENTPPATTDGSTGGGLDGEGEGDGSTSEGINALLQLIRDMLAGNNVTFGDWADAIINLFGNAELTDIIEMLIDDNIDISDMFQQFLESLGFDFGMLEDLLNKIIQFFKDLFGPDDGPDDVTDTTAAAPNLDTTAQGSSSGSEETGDVGIALAATVCVAASAAFVLTRKKKETV